MARVGDRNVFGMRVTAVRGRWLDLECDACRESGSAPADEFQSTRCGSAHCGGTQGKSE